MSLFKCLVPVLVLLLVEGSSARPGAYAKDYYYPPTGQQPAVMVQNGGSLVYGNGNVTSIGTYNGGSSGTFETPCSGGCSMGNGNAVAKAEATATAKSDTTSGSIGKIEAQNPLHVEGPQAPGVNGNGQGNGHPDGETTAATAVSQSRADGEATATANSETTSSSTGIIEEQNPLYVEGPQAPAVNGNGQGNGHSDGETTAATAVSPSRADGEATATANSETTSGSIGKIEAQNPLHVEGPQAPGVNGNGQGNGHPDGETTVATAVSQSRVNHFLSQPGQWIFFPFQVVNARAGAGLSTFGGYGPASGSRVLGANSASNAVANAGSSTVGGSSVGNGNAAANAEATATANSETTSGSTADAVSNAN